MCQKADIYSYIRTKNDRNIIFGFRDNNDEILTGTQKSPQGRQIYENLNLSSSIYKNLTSKIMFGNSQSQQRNKKTKNFLCDAHFVAILLRNRWKFPNNILHGGCWQVEEFVFQFLYTYMPQGLFCDHQILAQIF